MKWFETFVVIVFIHKYNAIPTPLQGFGTGDQTTGSKWPVHGNIDKQCFFVTGYVDGEEDRSIGTANSAQECLDLIKNVERTADGMTWDSMSRKCFAEFGSEMIFSVCDTCKACIFNERMNMPAPPPPPLHTNNIKITPSTDTDEELPTPQQLGTHLRPPDLDPLDFPPPNSQLEFSLHHQVGHPHSPTTEASYGSDNRWSKPYGPDKTESPYGFDNQYGSNPNKSDSANFQPKDYNQYQKRVRCSKWPESIIRNFRFSKELMKNASSANIECQTFCSQNEACWGCTVDCNDQSCQWNAIKKCRALERINQKTEDADWCRVANPDCSKLYTQQACKNYCSISEEYDEYDIAYDNGTVKSNGEVRSIGNVPVDTTRSQGTTQPRDNSIRRKRPRINIVDENASFANPDRRFPYSGNNPKFDKVPQNTGEFSVPQSNRKSFTTNPKNKPTTEITNRKSTEDLYSQEANPKPLEADPDNL